MRTLVRIITSAGPFASRQDATLESPCHAGGIIWRRAAIQRRLCTWLQNGQLDAILVWIFHDSTTPPGRIPGFTDDSNAVPTEARKCLVKGGDAKADVHRCGSVASLAWIELEHKVSDRCRIMSRSLAMLLLDESQSQESVKLPRGVDVFAAQDDQRQRWRR